MELKQILTHESDDLNLDLGISGEDWRLAASIRARTVRLDGRWELVWLSHVGTNSRRLSSGYNRWRKGATHGQ